MARRKPQVQRGAWIDKEASIDPSCTIGQGVGLLGKVELEEKVRIEPNSVIYGPAMVGSGSFIGPNVVLGFPPKSELAASVRKRRNVQDAPERRMLIIGRDCIIRSGTCVYSNTSIGDSVSFGHNVMVREDVRIGKRTLVGTGVVIDGSCDIGERVSIQTGAYICTNCKIEDFVFLGPCAVLTNDKYMMQKKTTLFGPTIRRGASIGANVLLMPSVEVGEGAVVGAQSLVTHNVPARSVYVGVPAKRLKEVPADWRSLLMSA